MILRPHQILLYTLSLLATRTESLAGNPEVKLLSISAEAYESLAVDRSNVVRNGGTIQVAELPGQVMLAVRIDYKVLWRKDTRVLTHESGEIVLEDDVTLYKPVGCFDESGKFQPNKETMTMLRPRDWQMNPEQADSCYWVFVLPKALLGRKRNVTISSGGREAQLELPEQAGRALDMAPGIQARVTEATLHQKVLSQAGFGRNTLPTHIRNPHGVILEVTIEFTPSKPNSLDNRSYRWSTNWFGLLVNNCSLQPIGQYALGKISHNRQNTSPVGQADTARLYFAVPSNTKDFKLLHLTNRVADGSITTKVVGR